MVAFFGRCDKIFIHRIILPYHFLLENIINFKDIYVMNIILVKGKDWWIANWIYIIKNIVNSWLVNRQDKFIKDSACN